MLHTPKTTKLSSLKSHVGWDTLVTQFLCILRNTLPSKVTTIVAEVQSGTQGAVRQPRHVRGARGRGGGREGEGG